MLGGAAAVVTAAAPGNADGPGIVAVAIIGVVTMVADRGVGGLSVLVLVVFLRGGGIKEDTLVGGAAAGGNALDTSLLLRCTCLLLRCDNDDEAADGKDGCVNFGDSGLVVL